MSMIEYRKNKIVACMFGSLPLTDGEFLPYGLEGIPVHIDVWQHRVFGHVREYRHKCTWSRKKFFV